MGNATRSADVESNDAAVAATTLSSCAATTTTTTTKTTTTTTTTTTTSSWHGDFWMDFVAGWCSGAVAVLACQPLDTLLTLRQANAAAATANRSSSLLMAQNLVATHGMSCLWRGSTAMIGAVPLQNALLMTGYAMGKRWSGHPADDNDNTNSTTSSSTSSLWAVFVGGCTGGVIQSFLMSPVELVKVTQQVKGRTMAQATKAVVQGLWKLPSSSSVFSHSNSGWRGLNATLLRDGIPHGIWFVSYEYTKNAMTTNDDNDNVASSFYTHVTIPLVSGAMAATAAWGVGYPFDLIKTRIQASSSGASLWTTAVELAREPGGGLYRGLGFKLLRAIPASAIGFTVYEMMQRALSGVLA